VVYSSRRDVQANQSNIEIPIMTKDQLGRLYPVEIHPYDPRWPRLFREEKSRLQAIFGGTVRIEHIGSTAVEGLSAKPTIDILMEKPTGMDASRIIVTLQDQGYIHMKEQTRHLMFVKGYTSAGLAAESFHIHIGPIDQEWLWDRTYLRDYLIAHPAEARRYEELKKKLAARYRHDRDAYTDAKADYIRRITEKGKATAPG